ncbi:MAG: DUF2834 domain-containing protein [Kaiparowitsia implicata GSE-PSE-MK54-09C]|jgi:hypothetical protein|nr:DUF2834 domain-containing protein [Kaiparowitsia implicata GSE-PSE-MK54-09C]
MPFFLLWLGFISYAALLAPPDDPNTLMLIRQLATGQWQGINPLIVALFNIMGIWPLVYASVLLADGRGQRVPAWPFVTASFGVGAFALLPYLGLRRSNPTFVGEKGSLLALLDSRWTGRAIALGGLALLVYGVTAGDWSDFIAQWRTSKFIHVMSLDFCALALLFPAVLADDMTRRGMKADWRFWGVAVLPYLGAIAYLALRPRIQPNAAPDRPQDDTADLKANSIS